MRGEPSASATGAVVAGKEFECAFQSTGRGVSGVVIPYAHYYNGDNGRSCRYRCQAVVCTGSLHQPIKALTNIEGIMPRANDSIISHAAHSEAFFDLSRLHEL